MTGGGRALGSGFARWMAYAVSVVVVAWIATQAYYFMRIAIW
ncbi:MAG: hypothetical protein QOH33_1317, partial [Paraburkholderia sp.]|nr:hypothetical protein [Paraburkholderia sp.]